MKIAQNHDVRNIVQGKANQLSEERELKKALKEIVLLDASDIQKFEMWGRELWYIEVDGDNACLTFYLPVIFDTARTFGQNICVDKKVNSVPVYLTWQPKNDDIKLAMHPTTPDIDEAYEIKMSAEQVAALRKTFCEHCRTYFGHTPQELWEANKPW